MKPSDIMNQLDCLVKEIYGYECEDEDDEDKQETEYPLDLSDSFYRNVGD